jgi:hypothetical protein
MKINQEIERIKGIIETKEEEELPLSFLEIYLMKHPGKI